MSRPTIGSLCTGYGGLDDAVVDRYGGTVAWLSEFDKYAAIAAQAAHPDTPNYGDLTAIDWASIEPVDILTAGYPCQPFSTAGHRRGTDDARHIWPWIADAIRLLRPRLVVLENVAGHLRLGFDTVLADLAELGYDTRWGVVRASDAGAPHQRARLFITAHPADPDGGQQSGAEAEEYGLQQPAQHHPRVELLATPRAAMDPGRMSSIVARPNNNRLEEDIAHLLPTPVVNDMGEGKTVDRWDQWTAEMKAKHGNGNRHGASLSIEALRLLSTPTAALGGGGGQRDHRFRSTGPARAHNPAELAADWSGSYGQYQPAIDRWASIIGRPPPAPVENDHLNPAFVEWMMGLPEGRVTGLGLSPVRQLKILGNGVVPQQGALALQLLDTL